MQTWWKRPSSVCLMRYKDQVNDSRPMIRVSKIWMICTDRRNASRVSIVKQAGNIKKSSIRALLWSLLIRRFPVFPLFLLRFGQRVRFRADSLPVRSCPCVWTAVFCVAVLCSIFVLFFPPLALTSLPPLFPPDGVLCIAAGLRARGSSLPSLLLLFLFLLLRRLLGRFLYVSV